MDATFRDRAVYLPAEETLVVADLHLGKGASSSVELPLGGSEDVVQRLDALLDAHDVAELVVAGDVLHSFETVPRAASAALADLRGVARDRGVRPVVTPGNHDTMLDSVWSGPTEPEYPVGDAVVLHGHEPPDEHTGAERYIVGHDHPALDVEGRKWPCYLDGRGVYGGADVLVLPAFNRLVAGVSVNGRAGRDTLERSPLVTDIGAFRPVVRDDDAGETRQFPPLAELREFL